MPVSTAVRAAGPTLVFGLRLWASVCLALYVAFWLELDNAYWAGTSAALMCQPHLGASLRKGWFRMIGTVVGAVWIVALSAWFPQDRVGFLLGLALWGAACACVATLLRNFAAYAAALAGFTAAILASDTLGATGGTDGHIFNFAIMRVSEIWIGIVCAGIVLAGTDFGAAPRRLAKLFADLADNIVVHFRITLTRAAPFSDTQPIRREFARRVIALDPVIDEAIGESSWLRYRAVLLQQAVDGLFAALAGWRTVAVRLAALPADVARHQAATVLQKIPDQFSSTPRQGVPSGWLSDPIGMRKLCVAAARSLVAMPAETPSFRLVADEAARVLAGLSRVLDGLALLIAGHSPGRVHRRRLRFYVPDWLPALANGGRAFVAIGAVAVFWIVSEWPNGAMAITWTAIGVLLFAPRADEACARTVGFMVGNVFAAVCAAIAAFALLPQVETFVGFSMVMGLFLIPLGALMAQPWQTAMFTALAANFVPLLAPTNLMTYNTLQFYNTALSIVVGGGVAALSYRLLPPLSPSFRTGRLLAFTLRDLRRLAIGAQRVREDWEGRMYSRLAVLPDQAEPLQRAQLVAALSVGTEIIHLPGSCLDLAWTRSFVRRLRISRVRISPQRGQDLRSSINVWLRFPTPACGRRFRCERAADCFPSTTPSFSIATILMREPPVEVRGDRFIRRLRCADLIADGGRMARYHRIAPRRGPFRPGALRLASGAVVFAVYIIVLSPMVLIIAR